MSAVNPFSVFGEYTKTIKFPPKISKSFQAYKELYLAIEHAAKKKQNFRHKKARE